MNTEECKELLAAEYPDTEEKQWRRVSKYKNSFGEDIRQFSHPEIGDVWLLDDEDEADIYTSCNHSNVMKKGSIKPSDYFFTIDSNSGLNNGMVIYFVLKQFFEGNKSLDDRHDMLPGDLVSKSLVMVNLAESAWALKVTVSATDATKKLSELGFSQDSRLDMLITGARFSGSSRHRDDQGPGF